MVLRWILGPWLRGEAVRRAEQAVREAAGDAQREATEPAETAAPADVSCDVGIVAEGRAAGSCVDRLQGAKRTEGDGLVSWRGTCGDRTVVVIRGAEGPEGAARAARALIRGHAPRAVIAAGLASGLADDVARGDLVLARQVGDGESQSLDLEVAEQTPAGVHVGRVVSLPEPPRSPEAKRQLGRRAEALAADRSSFAVATAAAAAGVRCLVLCAIRDAVEDRLPDDVEFLQKQQSLAGRLGAAAGALARRPGSAKDIWQLQEDALVVADRLAEQVERLIAAI